MEEKKMVCQSCGRELSESNFKMTRWGFRSQTCNECVSEKQRLTKHEKRLEREMENEAEKTSARKLRLQDFSPRELMEELARRGYEGKLTYTEVHTIDITDF